MKKLILCDFDGTISLEDMGYVLINRFSSGNWEEIDREFCQGNIGSKEAYSRIAKILKGNKKDFLDVIRDHSKIDPNFSAFYQYCRENDIEVKIVSDGLDSYIREVLEIHHLAEIPFYANHTQFPAGKGIEFSFPYANEECGLCGTCKKRLVQAHRNEYHPILFIGDGLSDRCAAQEADFVFAKDFLYTHCIERDITCHFFRDFHEILMDLKKMTRGIIFDLDGTLIEAYEAIYLGLRDAFQHFGREIFPLSDLKKYLRADLETTLDQFFSSKEVSEGVPIMRKKYEEVYLEKTHFLDGAKEVLERLHSKGILLAVASNKFGPFSREALKHLGVSDHFKSVLGAGDVPRNKPFPDMIQAALNEMGLLPEDVVFVGDTLSDIDTGKQAGVDVYALPTGFHSKLDLSQGKPKRILKNLKELIDVAFSPLGDCVVM
jgi:2-hydroxy-3-keto-5-methylthiopentenyl-1-phosphate phosphatase